MCWLVKLKSTGVSAFRDVEKLQGTTAVPLSLLFDDLFDGPVPALACYVT